MRDVYTAKLSRLSDEILEMGNLCGQAIMKTCQLLASVEVREAATKEIGRIEKEIDDKEHNIEALCMQLLLKQQPVGTDLRKISAALKMVTDMERIGDQATDIAEILNTGSVHVPVTAIPLQEMADYAMHMVNDSVTAYVEGKSDLAKKVISSDDILDNLFNKVRNALDQNTMGFSSDEVLDLLMISKYYERIGDHATNIMEIGAARRKEKSRFSAKAEHEIENHKAMLKAGDDPKKQRRVKKKQPPEGFVSWNKQTFERLIAAEPEKLRPRLRITHSMVLAEIEQGGDAWARTHKLIEDSAQTPEEKAALSQRTDEVFLRTVLLEPKALLHDLELALL